MDGAQSLVELIREFSGERFYLYPAILLGAAVLVYAIGRWAVLPLVHGAIRRTRAAWNDSLVARSAFGLLPLVPPAILLQAGVEYYAEYAGIIRQILGALIAAFLTLTIARALDAANDIYETLAIARRRPIKGYIQLAKIFIYILGSILAICALIDQSPWGIIGGLGAMTAVLVLVFRDTILAFNASLQIMSADMVRKGDWIEVPAMGADGEVVEIALYMITVRNWDKTTVNVPTYKLIDSSFKNWRSMEESGGRRIKRSLLIDQSSIRFCDEAMLARLRAIDILKDYLAAKEKQIAAANAGLAKNEPVANRRTLTNLGTFRAYVTAYLRASSKLRQDMTLMVRHLAPTAQGLPLELYCFSADTDWVAYESIQADLFDHLLSVLPVFELRVFQNPTGGDFHALAGPKSAPGGGEGETQAP